MWKIRKYVGTWIKSISKFHFLVKLYKIGKKSYDTKLFTAKIPTNLNRNIFFIRFIYFILILKITVENPKFNFLTIICEYFFLIFRVVPTFLSISRDPIDRFV